MNSRLGSNPQSSGMKRKFPGDAPTDPRFHSGPSRPPVHLGNMASGPSFSGRGGPPQFSPSRGAPFPGRQGPPPGRGRGRGMGPGSPPTQMMRGGGGGRGPSQPFHRGGHGPRSAGRGPPMRGVNPMMGRGPPGPDRRGSFGMLPPPPPPMQQQQQQQQQHYHMGGRGGPMGSGGRGLQAPPPPPPPPPMHQSRHLPPHQQANFSSPGFRPPPHQQQQLSGPPPQHMQHRFPPLSHHQNFGGAVPPPNAPPPPFLPSGNSQFPNHSSVGTTSTQLQQQQQQQLPHENFANNVSHHEVHQYPHHRFQVTPNTTNGINSQQDGRHHQQPAMAAIQSQQQGANTPSSTSYTKDQIDQAWTEHRAPNGMSYYYNSLTKESTYQMPSALEAKGPSQVVPTPTQAQKQSTERVWVEYTDPSTGKNYYSDGHTTTWTKPDEQGVATVADHPTKPNVVLEATKVEMDDAAAVDSVPANKKKKRANNSKKESPFLSKAEATAAFKGLLLAKGIAPNLKWNDVAKLCSSDTRWADCEDVLTLGERKQALAEYQTKRANELRTMERQERIRAKEAFQQLLTAVLPSLPAFHASSSRFADIRDSLSKDDRFYAVQDEDTRESLFLDFCEEVRKRDDRNRNNKKRECKDAFLSFLREKEEEGILTFASTWTSFISSLSGENLSDSRFVVSSAMSDADRQVYYADFLIELQAAEDDKRRRIRDARRRAEKAQREAYRDALRSMAVDGLIVPSTRWRSVEDMISAHSTYTLVHDQDREAPREIFEDFVEEWNEVYRRDRALLAELVRPGSNRDIVVTTHTTYDEFTKAILLEASYSPELHAETRHIINHTEPISSARVYFNELVAKAKESSGPLPRTRRSVILQPASEDEGEIVEEGEVTELDDKELKQEGNGANSVTEPTTHVDVEQNPEVESANAEPSEGQLNT